MPSADTNSSTGGAAASTGGAAPNVGGAPGSSGAAPSAGSGGGADVSSSAAGSHAGGSASLAGSAGTSDSGGAATGGSSCTNGALTIHGHVSSPHGAPVLGIPVALTGSATATASTDASGEYAFEHLCSGSYQLLPLCTASPASIVLEQDAVHDFAGVIADCDASAIEPRVLVVIYDPMVTGPGAESERLSTSLSLEPPDALATRLLDTLQATTNGHVRPVVTAVKTSLGFPPSLDGFRYTEADYAACLADPQSCHAAAADYAAISAEEELCDAVQTGNVDQIWMLGGAHFGFPASQQLVCPVQVDAQEIQKVLDVIGMSYGGGMAGVLAAYQAHSDTALRQVFGSGPSSVIDNPYGLFIQAQGSTPGAEASGCGNLSFAPNSLDSQRFDDERVAPSYCDAFLRYPLLQPPLASAVSCVAWGCSEQGYRSYWLSHLPKANWSDAKGKLNDFWRYILRPDERLPAEAVTVTCSSSYQPGWCNHVRDGQQGVCNSNEWATAGKSTGFVEFLFNPKQVVSGVELYDRACDEQVLAGHLEFSDGSSNVTFGALEPSGKEFSSVTFAPKLLSGLRVVIDASSGENPGFGEITVVGSAAPAPLE
jgi:Carboxypeptidase regulatory-like domain